jgi:hypothetical protein
MEEWDALYKVLLEILPGKAFEEMGVVFLRTSTDSGGLGTPGLCSSTRTRTIRGNLFV